MGRLWVLDRKPGKITVEILYEGRIINGKFVAAGNVRVVSGLVDEEYWLTPEVVMAGYEPDDDFLAELRKANQGKL